MSYDLMVFNHKIAPANEEDFFTWYDEQTEWGEDHKYDNPAITTSELESWYNEMNHYFKPLNDTTSSSKKNKYEADYCIGYNFIYVSFSWSHSKTAYKKMKELAEKHQLGFFDISGNEDILIPNENGSVVSIRNQDHAHKTWWQFW